MTSENVTNYKPFVADSANLTIQIDRLVPNRSYEFGLVEFNHMRDESNVSDIVFSNIDANVQKDTLTDNVSISYDNIETDLLDSSGIVAYVRFTNFTFSTDAPNKKYDMTISLVNNNESDTTNDPFSFIQDNIDEHVDGDAFSITSLREDVLYFENIDVSFTFLNSTDQVDVDSVFDDTIIGADPFSVPTEIKLAGNTGDSLAVYLDGFNFPPLESHRKLLRERDVVRFGRKLGQLVRGCRHMEQYIEFNTKRMGGIFKSGLGFCIHREIDRIQTRI